jgi:N-acetylmuramoyl-L-alanine amidase
VRQGMRDARARQEAIARSYPTTPIYRPTPPPVAAVVAAPKPPAPKAAAIEAGPGWVPAVAERPWRYVVMHHSDDTSGCCHKYDKIHRGQGWENGCGYHFVVGNGSMTPEGMVEVGPRWVSQIQGAHAKTPDNRFNEEGVGIVLVGDFEHGPAPTRVQYESAVHLTRWLMARYHISPDRVLRHQDAKATACPGKNFPWARFLADVSTPPAVATPP